jgi:lipopolysaccharide biosynthesis glycosyltransferase
MPRNSIQTLLCINAAYAQHAAVCIVSLLENNPQSHFELVVVSSQPLGAGEEKLKRTIARYDNASLEIKYFGASSGMNLPVGSRHYTIDNYTRIWVADFFPPEVERVLYLDGDMVVVGNIDELWNVDLGQAVVAAATIPGSTRCAAYGIPERFGYFNSGVLVIDLTRWRRQQIFDVLRDYIANNADKLVDADQDALNACLFDKRRPVPFVWNVIVPFYFNYHPLGISKAELRQVRRDARIIHFNGPSKPWSYQCNHPRKAEYWKYIKRTEWRAFTPPDRSFANWGKRTFGPFVPQSLRALLKRAT